MSRVIDRASDWSSDWFGDNKLELAVHRPKVLAGFGAVSRQGK
jgi:hypothetical protein